MFTDKKTPSSDSRPEKAPCGKLITELGIDIYLTFFKPRKAFAEIVLMPNGMVIISRSALTYVNSVPLIEKSSIFSLKAPLPKVAELEIPLLSERLYVRGSIHLISSDGKLG